MKSLALSLASTVLALACSGGEGRPPPYQGSDAPDPTPAASSVVPPAPCEDGDVKSCKFDLPTHDGIQSCWTGVRLCAGGTWTECGDEEALWKKYFPE